MTNPWLILTDQIASVQAGQARLPSYRWATVTQASPLRIRMDGDTSPLPFAPVALAPCTVGDRVLCVVVNRRLTVVGNSNVMAGIGATWFERVTQAGQLTPNGWGPVTDSQATVTLESTIPGVVSCWNKTGSYFDIPMDGLWHVGASPQYSGATAAGRYLFQIALASKTSAPLARSDISISAGGAWSYSPVSVEWRFSQGDRVYVEHYVVGGIVGIRFDLRALTLRYLAP